MHVLLYPIFLIINIVSTYVHIVRSKTLCVRERNLIDFNVTRVHIIPSCFSPASAVVQLDWIFFVVLYYGSVVCICVCLYEHTFFQTKSFFYEESCQTALVVLLVAMVLFLLQSDVGGQTLFLCHCSF